jgi:hypothetical protein
MTYVILRMPIKRMRLDTMAKLFVTSVVILAGSPAVACQVARHNAHLVSRNQKANPYDHRTFGAPLASEGPHWYDEWPNNIHME